MPSSISERKRVLRQEMLQRRDALAPETRVELSEALAAGILASDAYQNASLLLSYAPIRSEADITAVTLHALADHKRVALPRTAGDEMSFYLIQDLQTLQPGRFGIPEPPASCPRLESSDLLTQRTLVLFPGCAFTREGARLGYGGGYYDRYFQNISDRNIIRAGAAFSAQLVPALPVTEYDVKLDLVFTEDPL